MNERKNETNENGEKLNRNYEQPNQQHQQHQEQQRINNTSDLKLLNTWEFVNIKGWYPKMYECQKERTKWTHTMSVCVCNGVVR